MARGKLSSFTAKKPTTEPQVIPAEAQNKAAPKTTKAMTLRLNIDAWKQLKLLGIDDGRTVHGLLIDAVNDYLVKRGKPPVA